MKLNKVVIISPYGIQQVSIYLRQNITLNPQIILYPKCLSHKKRNVDNIVDFNKILFALCNNFLLSLITSSLISLLTLITHHHITHTISHHKRRQVNKQTHCFPLSQDQHHRSAAPPTHLTTMTSSATRTASFGSWESPISASFITSQSIKLSSLEMSEDKASHLFWVREKVCDYACLVGRNLQR